MGCNDFLQPFFFRNQSINLILSKMNKGKKLYYINGISLYQYKKFIEFLFGKGCVVKSKKNFEKFEYDYYIKKSSLNTEKRMTYKTAFETFFTGINLIPID